MRMKTRKIVVVHITQAGGGVDIGIQNISRFIDDRRFESHIIQPPGDGCFKTKSGRQIRQHFVSFGREIQPYSDAGALFHILRVLNRLKPDLIHAHSAKGGLIGRLAGRILNIPTLYTPHAFSFLSAESGIKGRVYLYIEKLARLFTHRFLACSQSELEIGNKIVGIAGKKSRVWQNCIDPALFKIPRKKVFEFQYFCICGRPSHQKNLEYLVEIMNKLKTKGSELKCIITGVGHYSPLKQAIEKKIKAFHLEDNILMIKWLSHQESMNIMSNAMFYVSTSRYEGLPFSIIEAAALGKPVIATDVYGNRDCVVHGETGFLFPLDATDEVSDTIIRMENNHALRARLGINATAYINDKFNIVKTIGGLEDIYLEAAGTSF